MYDHQIQEDFFYMMLYGVFRRANAIAPDVTSSVRLRRWTAAFFACMTLSHLWYLPVAFHTSSEEILQCYLVGAMLDFMTLIPCAIVLLLVLLQDHRRPLWPVGVMVAPVIIGLAVSLVYSYFDIMPQFYGYHLLLAIGLIIYMVRATRQYGHWLRDNYAPNSPNRWAPTVSISVSTLPRRVPPTMPTSTVCVSSTSSSSTMRRSLPASQC